MVTPQFVLSLSLGFRIASIPSRLRPPVFRLDYVVSIEWVAVYAKKNRTGEASISAKKEQRLGGRL